MRWMMKSFVRNLIMRRIDCIIFIKIMICPVDIHCLYAFIVTSRHQPWQMSSSSKFNEQKYLHTYIYINSCPSFVFSMSISGIRKQPRITLDCLTLILFPLSHCDWPRLHKNLKDFGKIVAPRMRIISWKLLMPSLVWNPPKGAMQNVLLIQNCWVIIFF